MEAPKISILIANYNNGHFFEDCFRSLIAQTEQDWEAIIIDDSSTDNSVDIISNIISGEKRVQFHKNATNLGYQKTIIKALQYSSAKIFARLDPDDALTNKAIELSLQAHEKNPNAGLVYSNFIFCDENLNRQSIHKGKQIINLDIDYFNFNGEISHFASFKKQVFDLTTGFDEKNKKAEDKDIYMKMCEVAPVKHLDEDLYLYRLHQGGVSTGKNAQKALFWHWVALTKMAERRNIDISDLFLDKWIPRSVYDKEVSNNRHYHTKINKSRWIKIGKQLGLLNWLNK